MIRLSLTVIIASITAGFYWNNPAYDSFIINPSNRLNPQPEPYVWCVLPGQKLKDHCEECTEIRNGKKLTVSEIRDVLKRHVLDKDQPVPDGYSIPPLFVTK